MDCRTAGDRGWRDVRAGRGPRECLAVDRVGVGRALARGLGGRQGFVGVPAERSSRPRCSPGQVPDGEAARICALRQRTGWSPRRLANEPGVDRPHSTVHRVLQRAGCSRRPAPERPAVIRYEWPCPGNLLHMDVKKFGKFTQPGHRTTSDRTVRSRRVGWEYVHSIVDDCSRIAY